MSKVYAFAVIPSQGCYGSDSKVRAAYRTNDRERAIAKAKSLTAAYQRDMRSVGGSSGGYRAIEWGQEGNYLGYGHEADRVPSLK